MASVQERLQLKRTLVDSWSIREQLCLASAVTCSGDQNWVTVSRALKQLCGNGRPAEWFSQKSCAIQYGELLENAETPKRKKRNGLERESPSTEIPTEAILRKLTQERIAEIKMQIQQQQEEFAKITDEIRSIENGNFDENQLKAMWQEIEMEMEQKEQEQKLAAQWSKEREERKIDIPKSPWRQTNVQQSPSGRSPSPHTKPPLAGIKIKQEEMEVDETNSNKGTSPLLTSLLKSPSSATITSTAGMIPPTTATNVRQTAPTITNLLTGSTAPQTLLQSTSTTTSFHPIQNQPLTGPVPPEPTPQVTPTPSQAAPTLSMLLENKNSARSAQANSMEKDVASVSAEDKKPNDESEPMETEESQDSPSKEEEQQLMEVFNDLIPDNIDELEDILTNNNAIILNPDLLEGESILENVESLIDEQEEIDEKNVPLIDEQKPIQMDSKNLTEPSDSSKIKETVKEENDNALDPEIVPKPEPDADTDLPESIVLDESNDKTMTPVENLKEVVEIVDNSENSRSEQDKESPDADKEPEQIEVSDDSSDNACLQSIKEHIHDGHKGKGNSDVKSDRSADLSILDHEESLHHVPSKASDKMDSSDTESRPEELIFSVTTRDNSNDKRSSNITEIIEIHEVSSSSDSKTEPDRDEVKSTPTISLDEKKNIREDNKKTDSSRSDNKSSGTEKASESASGRKDAKNDSDAVTDRISDLTPITIIDTDDDSPMEIKEDKTGKTKRDYSRKKPDTVFEKKTEDLTEDNRCNLSIRKLKERDGSESPLVDDENADSIPRTRRRYSSTPVIDSIPNSPASSDDREYKAWKKSILMVFNRLVTHKHSAIFMRPVTEDQAPNYKTIVLRPMDLHTIKRNIESGAIRTTNEFQRDVMLMCENAIMYNKTDNNIYNMAKEMMTESVQIIESVMETIKRESDRTQIGASMIKSRSRKSRY